MKTSVVIPPGLEPGIHHLRIRHVQQYWKNGDLTIRQYLESTDDVEEAIGALLIGDTSKEKEIWT